MDEHKRLGMVLLGGWLLASCGGGGGGDGDTTIGGGGLTRDNAFDAATMTLGATEVVYKATELALAEGFGNTPARPAAAREVVSPCGGSGDGNVTVTLQDPNYSGNIDQATESVDTAFDNCAHAPVDGVYAIDGSSRLTVTGTMQGDPYNAPTNDWSLTATTRYDHLSFGYRDIRYALDGAVLSTFTYASAQPRTTTSLTIDGDLAYGSNALSFLDFVIDIEQDLATSQGKLSMEGKLVTSAGELEVTTITHLGFTGDEPPSSGLLRIEALQGGGRTDIAFRADGARVSVDLAGTDNDTSRDMTWAELGLAAGTRPGLGTR